MTPIDPTARWAKPHHYDPYPPLHPAIMSEFCDEIDSVASSTNMPWPHGLTAVFGTHTVLAG